MKILRHRSNRASWAQWCGCGALVLGLGLHDHARAVPPPAAALSAANVGKKTEARWVKHRVVPGELVTEVAARYGVAPEDLIKWNKLKPGRETLRSGSRLRVLSHVAPPQVSRVYHTVKTGESWSSIANQHGVPVDHLRERWNANIKRLRVNDQIAVWVEKRESAPAEPELQSAVQIAQVKVTAKGGDPQTGTKTLVSTRLRSSAVEVQVERHGKKARAPETKEEDDDADFFPIMEVPLRSRSLGHPHSGRILRGIQMPSNDTLYTLRDPERSYVSSHTAMVLQNALARFRLISGYRGMVLIKDTSRKGGGPLYPHKSHQSGRDADIQLLLRENTTDYHANNVDWAANWSLLHSMMQSNRIRYIFLSWPQQRLLYRAAKRAGMTDEALEPLLEFPKRGRPAIIRDEHGHDTHFHVRVDCAPWEDRCIN